MRGVSTDEQGTDPQLDELPAAGCATIEQLEEAGAHFRSLRDPIDTTTPQAVFSLQVLGAVAQLERALIAERTKAGVTAARARGRIGGNPGLRAGDPNAIRKLRASRDAAHLDGVLAQPDSWLPTVRRMRPDQPWGDVVRVLNRAHCGHLDGRAAAPNGAAAGRRKASSSRACWTAPGHSRATTGWSVWSPESRRRRPIARSSKSPPNSTPCTNERREVAREVVDGNLSHLRVLAGSHATNEEMSMRDLPLSGLQW